MEFTPDQAFKALQRVAAADGHRRTDQLLELYLHERFLARLSVSEFRSNLVLKGGMLLATFDVRRPTRDADFLALRLSNDEAEVRKVIAAIAAVPMEDGVTFETSEAQIDMVREEAEYHGVRAHVPARISTAKLRLALDISFGEQVDAREVTIPTLLDDKEFTLNGYPMSFVVAEKAETMMARGDANTRDRDWADVLRLSYTHPFVARELLDALRRTAESRARQLVPIASVITDLGIRRQSSWTALLGRHHAEGVLPASFPDAIGEVIAFIDPLVTGQADDGSQWDPDSRSWRS